MGNLIPLEGKRFGNLVVIGRSDKRDPKRTEAIWKCRCDCGKETDVPGGHLRYGDTRSCGCLEGTTHGASHLPEHSVWNSMKRRCQTPSNACYYLYGGRGIKVCERWSNSFVDFLTDTGPRPSPNHSIDRIDVNGNYEPGNCRWSSTREQSRNRRNTAFIEFHGQRKPLVDWAEELVINPGTLRSRISKGWPPEIALRPVRNSDRQAINRTKDAK